MHETACRCLLAMPLSARQHRASCCQREGHRRSSRARSPASSGRPMPRLHERADALAEAVKTLCADALAGQSLDRRATAFRAAADAWSYVEIIRFGPVTEAEPAGAHAVLAGPQGHRPEAGAGGTRRQGRRPPPIRRSCRQERRHARARRAGVRAVRHRRGGACRDRRSLSLRYGAAVAANIDDDRRAMSTRPGQKPDGFAAAMGAIRAADNPLYQTGTRGGDRTARGLRQRAGAGARRAPRRLPRRASRRTTSRSRRSTGARTARRARWPPTSPA